MNNNSTGSSENFFVNIPKAFSGKWLYEKHGLSTKTVFFRWVQLAVTTGVSFTAIYYLSIYGIYVSYAESISRTFKLSNDIDLNGSLQLIFPIYISGLFGTFLALYFAMKNEFVSKYRDLLQMVDSLKSIRTISREDGKKGFENLYFISSDALKFADSALRWNLERHTEFVVSFNMIVSYLDHTRRGWGEYYEAFRRNFPNIADYLEKNDAKHLYLEVSRIDKEIELLQEWSGSERRKNSRLREIVELVFETANVVKATFESKEISTDNLNAVILKLDKYRNEIDSAS